MGWMKSLSTYYVPDTIFGGKTKISVFVEFITVRGGRQKTALVGRPQVPWKDRQAGVEGLRGHAGKAGDLGEGLKQEAGSRCRHGN